ncbi:MAG: SDR family NAD(P)-dependent oxidoreductase [Bryobacteraceae bacterium]
MSRLTGKIAVITGAASGIGKATADRFLREGAEVIPLDRANGIDAGDHIQVRQFFEPLSRVDILVNSAGIAFRKPVADQTEEEWDDLMHANLRGTYVCSRYAIPKMRALGGSIVHLSSVVGIVGVRNRAAYSASKGAIVALTRNMALDYAKDQIRVNCVCPGFTRTNLTKALFSNADATAKLYAMHPLGRLGEPEDVANLITFLVSDEASWITGQAIAVDGGFSVGHSVDV